LKTLNTNFHSIVKEVHMNRQILIIVTLFSLSFVFSGIVVAGAEDDSFRASVEEIFDTYSSANMNKDVESWIALWDEKGIKMAPKSPAIYGKLAIEELKRKKMKAPGDLEMSIKIEDTQIAGDFGFAHGTYFGSVTPEGGGAANSFEGKYLTIFKKQADGSWKIYRDAVSSNPGSK
jgi:ketosteroid isomerase-like protein